MDYAQGRVVRTIKGHDKDRLFLVEKQEEGFVWLRDGKNRKKHNPKKKSLKHIVITKHLIPEFESLSDKNIRKQLNKLKQEESL